MPSAVPILVFWIVAYLAVGLGLEVVCRLGGPPTPRHLLLYALTVGTFRALVLVVYLGCSWLALVIFRPVWERRWRFVELLDLEERKRGLS